MLPALPATHPLGLQGHAEDRPGTLLPQILHGNTAPWQWAPGISRPGLVKAPRRPRRCAKTRARRARTSLEESTSPRYGAHAEDRAMVSHDAGDHVRGVSADRVCFFSEGLEEGSILVGCWA